jgi:1-acyl-sn-glycerol-3-phosphate acyltransferase
MGKLLAQFIYFKVLKWQLLGDYKTLKTLPKAVIIVAPHTSWHDFYMGVLLRSIIDTTINYIGKKELFVFPFGWFFRALGGRPVDRKTNHNAVQVISKMFATNTIFRLALAPEGTRRKVKKWRTGFYHIAKTAQVPIIMVSLDFQHKKSTFSQPFYTTDHEDEDFEYIKKFFKGVKGKIPNYS